MKLFFKVIAAWLLSPSLLTAGELEERAVLREEFATLFERADYTELVRLSDHYLRSEEKTGSGTWKLVWYYQSIYEVVAKLDENDDHEWAAILEKIEQWRNEYPGSPAPIITYAGVLLVRGGLIRGTEYASRVPEEDMEEFIALMTKAAQYMVEHAEIGSKDPYWYVQLASLLRNFRDGEQVLSLLNEGIGRFPTFDQLYFMVAEVLNPKWHGSAQAVFEFAEKSRKATAETRGDEMYVRILWAAGHSREGTRLLLDREADWSMVVASMEDVLTKYPVQWNVNHFAMFACFKNDLPLALKYMKMVREPIIESAWSNIPVNYQICRLNVGLEPSPRVPMPQH